MVYGDLCTDVVQIGAKGSRSSVNANFLLLSIDSGFQDYEADGILGLGMSATPNLVQSLKASKNITTAVFALYLNHLGNFGDHNAYGSPASNLQIGGYDLDTYSTTKSIAATAAVDFTQGQWLTTATEITIGGLTATDKQMIFDTSLAFIYPDSESFGAVYSYLSGLYSCAMTSGFIACKCSETGNMPAVSITVGGVALEVPAERMWFKSGGYCALYMQSGGDSVWLIGDVFLQNYYNIYNIDAQTISFAPAIKSSYSAAVVIIASFAMIFAV